MGGILRRRELILPSGSLPEWDYEWDYSMGLLSDNGWTRTISGSASETLISTGDALKGKDDYVFLRKEDFEVPVGVVEVTFYVTGFSASQSVRVCFSNGTNGIQICAPSGWLCLMDHYSPSLGTRIGPRLTASIDYTLRLVLNGQVGEVWLDGVQLISDVDISTILYATRTSVWSQKQGNDRTVVKSVKLRKNRI